MTCPLPLSLPMALPLSLPLLLPMPQPLPIPLPILLPLPLPLLMAPPLPLALLPPLLHSLNFRTPFFFSHFLLSLPFSHPPCHSPHVHCSYLSSLLLLPPSSHLSCFCCQIKNQVAEPFVFLLQIKV